ncbi:MULTISPECIES: phosphoenolpyruvate--protein phosphotransferase [unclassified Paenibacillus]|uniref:phosphoenolpyruvate--protein phosphotransferase n=1 Tax=unclassified Paenibacillus TaxID=185978 RepID=UPI000930D271|nr:MULTISPECIES: phosphoenolpyruvate--protein phosphotransferase [unclassified Paenibacillus]
MRQLHGVAAAPGYAMGPAHLLGQQVAEIDYCPITAEQTDAELERLEVGLREAMAELEQIEQTVRETVGEAEAEIIGSHLLMLDDPDLIDPVREKIQSELLNAEHAVLEVSQALIGALQALESGYIKQRADDLRDVRDRLLRHLRGESKDVLQGILEPAVLIARDLAPTDTIRLRKELVMGFATDEGGRASHTAIVARSLDIPAVAGLKSATSEIQAGDYIIVDGVKGVVIINPETEVLDEYRRLDEAYRKAREATARFREMPSQSADGVPIELMANIGSLPEARSAADQNADGIGLYRTEFLYMGHSGLPSEEEQVEAYRSVIRVIGPDKPLIIRSLDIGGDKELPALGLDRESNPFLGYRAIRMCLDRQNLFKTQLRAIARASAFGNVKLMYPMISSLSELREANMLLNEARQELSGQGILYNPQMEVGVMVEVPSAALIADKLAQEADFFSIGTNDLVQYALAVDRMNGKISHLYQPFHPAVLRLIYMTVEAARRKGIWVGMCGEMAGQPKALPLLLGMGLSELSMSPSSVLNCRMLLRQLNVKDSEKLAKRALELESAEAVERMLDDFWETAQKSFAESE